MTKARKITYIILFFVVAALLAVGGAYDLTIADELYAPENVMAQVFESIGIFPPFFIVAAMFATLFFVLNESKSYYLLKRIACIAGVAAAYAVFGYMAVSETGSTSSWLPYAVGAACAAVLTPVTLWIFSRVQSETRKKLFVFLLFATIVCAIANLLTINALKFIWSRPRYREMSATGDFTIYSVWYHINAFSLHGHHSFPSGHTASASALFTLCALGEVFPKYKEKETTIAFIVALFTFTMAYSRLVLGAHFLSDVTAGFAVTFVTYAVTRYLYFRLKPLEEMLSEDDISKEEYKVEYEEEWVPPTAPEEAGTESPVENVQEDAKEGTSSSTEDAGTTEE